MPVSIAQIEGEVYFFSQSLHKHHRQTLTRNIDSLRLALNAVRDSQPFDIIAMVVLPEQVHCIWRLPPGDDNSGARWSQFKALFIAYLPLREIRSRNRLQRRQPSVWLRKCYEYQIENQRDLQRYIDFVHRAPLKLGLVERLADWPYSSFHRYVRNRLLPADWCAGPEEELVLEVTESVGRP